MCVSFYMSVTWGHIADSYSPSLYNVNVSELFCAQAGARAAPSLGYVCPKNKKREILHTFLSHVEHAKCLVETRIQQTSKKTPQFPVSMGVSRQQNLLIGSRKVSVVMGWLSVGGPWLSESWWTLSCGHKLHHSWDTKVKHVARNRNCPSSTINHV